MAGMLARMGTELKDFGSYGNAWNAYDNARVTYGQQALNTFGREVESRFGIRARDFKDNFDLFREALDRSSLTVANMRRLLTKLTDLDYRVINNKFVR